MLAMLVLGFDFLSRHDNSRANRFCYLEEGKGGTVAFALCGYKLTVMRYDLDMHSLWKCWRI